MLEGFKSYNINTCVTQMVLPKDIGMDVKLNMQYKFNKLGLKILIIKLDKLVLIS